MTDGAADVVPVVLGHGGGWSGVDALKGEGFETIELGFVLGLILLEEGLDVVAGGGIVFGGEFGLEVDGEVFGEADGDGAHGGWIDRDNFMMPDFWDLWVGLRGMCLLVQRS